MNRIIQIVLCILVICCITTGVFAADAKYRNAMELYRAWVVSDAIPDYVCGAWSTGGVNMAFGIVDDEKYEQNKQTILNQIDNRATVTLVRMNPDDAYLYDIYYDAQSLFSMDVGLISMGVGDHSVHMEFVDTYMSNHRTQKEIQKYRGAYGEAVEYIFIGEAYIPVPHAEIPHSQPLISDGSMDVIWVFTVITLCAAVAMVFYTWKKRTPQYLVMGKNQLENNTCKPISLWTVKAELRHSAPDVPRELDERVLNSIHEKNNDE